MKKIIDALLRRKLLVLGILLYLALFFIDRTLFFVSFEYLKKFFIEMVQILPLVFILSALITEWVPSSLIQKHLGKNSGALGMLLSLLLGSVSAGPIYAAFPMTHSLYKKGASVRNLVVLLSSWATVKIPMLFVESSFLGFNFMILRYVLTIPAILLLAVIIGRWKGLSIPDQIEAPVPMKMNSLKLDHYIKLLPGRNCGACGFESCMALARSVGGEKELRKKCVFL
jgi:uncharacterized membrane protein YraQ (UPF0718 family)